MKNKLRMGAQIIVSLIGLVMVFGMLSVANAQWNLPTGNDVTLQPSEAACIPYHIDGATGTTEVLIAGTAGATGNTVTKTYGYVVWVQLSTGPAGSYLDILDTDKTGSGQKYSILPPLNFATPIVAGNVETGKVVLYSQFRPPFIFQNGLAAKLSSALTSATVCYRKMTNQFP